MSGYRIGKDKFLGKWASEFFLQLLSSFDIQVKQLKNIKYKSSREREVYTKSNSVYHDICFLYTIDYMKQISNSTHNNSFPNSIHEYPLYVHFAFTTALESIDNEEIVNICKQLKKIMDANIKYINSSKTAELLISKYSKNMNSYIEKNKDAIEDYLSKYSNSSDFSIQSIENIDGIDLPISLVKADATLVNLRPETNIFFDVNSKVLFPIMSIHCKEINYITPSRIGALIDFTKRVLKTDLHVSISLMNAQVIASVFQTQKSAIARDVSNTMLHTNMSIFSNKELGDAHEDITIQEKTAIYSSAILLHDFKKYFESIKPNIKKEISGIVDQFHRKDNHTLSPDMLYEIAITVKKLIGPIKLYAELKDYKKDIDDYLRLEINALISNTLKQKEDGT